jgi:hypothetical protein
LRATALPYLNLCTDTDEISTVYREKFPEFTRPALKPEAHTRDFSIKPQDKLNAHENNKEG